MPFGLSSWWSDSLKLVTNALLAEYTAEFGAISSPATDEMLTIVSPPLKDIAFAAACVSRISAVTDVHRDDLLGGRHVVLENGATLAEAGVVDAESYAAVEDGELWLVNSHIAPYKQAKTFGHEERRRRKLLVSRKQLADLWTATQRKGMTLVPLVMYFNHRGMAKIKLGIAKGKQNHDKRETSAKRDWSRQKSRLLKDNR